VKAKNGGPLAPDAVQGVIAHLAGVSTVERTDGEGPGTLGFRVRASGLQDPREAIFDAAIKSDFVLLDLHREHVSLEDTFRQLTVGEGGTDA
jgi:ABC-2 type transport system ATP-binding protein